MRREADGCLGVETFRPPCAADFVRGTAEMDVTITREQDLTPQQDREILDLQHAAFVNTAEFAHQRWWHSPPTDDLWVGARRDGHLVGSVRLVPRRIRVGDVELDVMGFGNVCSHPDARGTGAASACMTAGAECIRDAGVDFGLLFCGERVHGFYRRLGWRDVDNEVVYHVPDETGALVPGSGHACTMIHPAGKPAEEWPAGTVDLNGSDW